MYHLASRKIENIVGSSIENLIWKLNLVRQAHGKGLKKAKEH